MAHSEVEPAVDIYTDGACSGNPGPGGWGAVLRYGHHEKELYGGEATLTTNNRMELTAPIEALSILKRPTLVRLYTDSTYVRNGVLKWLPRWKSNGWLTSDRQPVKNADLWQRLDTAISRHEVRWYWVKGHAGNADNERADRLAVRGVREATGAGDPKSPTRPRPARAAPPAARPAGPAAPRCAATTRAGRPCPTVARASGFCHVHDPAVQCGATKKSGERCAAATGGGRCQYHATVGQH